MKTKNIVITLDPQYCRTLPDPMRRGHDVTIAFARVGDLIATAADIPKEVNPRAQNTKSRVSKQIRDGFENDSDVFHILNRGLTITALDTRMDTKTRQLHLTMAGNNYGLIDGGHTFEVIREMIQPILAGTDEAKKNALLDNYVKIEIINGVKGNLIPDLARARNTSAQVHDESLANLEGSFEWLKEMFKSVPFGGRIAYRENEDDVTKPVDVREVIALLTLFHPDFQDSENPPIMGYASKGRCLEMFRDSQDRYKQLGNIATEILRLYDYIHLKFPEFYESVGGFSALNEEVAKKGKSVKLAKVGEVRHYEEGFDLEYLGKMAYYRFPDGWLYPVVASMRGLVKYGRTTASWITGPAEFFDRYGKSMVKLTLEAARQSGRSPNAVGKNRNHWTMLHDRVLLNLSKMGH